MAVINLKHKRITQKVSISLIKKETGVKVWRHRYLLAGSRYKQGVQTFEDYVFGEFSGITQFEAFIEKQIEIQKQAKWEKIIQGE